MRILAFIFFSLSLFVSGVSATPWNLPKPLTTQNTEVTFEVDSTWHLVHGIAKQVEGKLWLEDPKDFRSVRGEVKLPVAEFDTDNSSRDSKLRKVMHADTSPLVTFQITGSVPMLCDPTKLPESAACSFEVPGELAINNVKKDVMVTASLTHLQEAYRISGVTTIKWADFMIDDPSILIAKLHDEVKISFVVILNLKD